MRAKRSGGACGLAKTPGVSPCSAVVIAAGCGGHWRGTVCSGSELVSCREPLLSFGGCR